MKELILRKLITMTLVASILVLGGCEKAESSPDEIRIEGGFGHLTSMVLKSDGTGLWHGYEPGRRMASQKNLSLNSNEIQRIWSLADCADVRSLSDEYQGGERTYKIVFVFQDGSKPMAIKPAPEDTRPPELKKLLDALWETRK